MFGNTFVPSGGGGTGGGDVTLISRVKLLAVANTFPVIAIPQTFKDLFITARLRSDIAGTGSGGGVRFNGDAGNNYNWTTAYFNGAATGYIQQQNVNNPVMFPCTGALAFANFWGTGTSQIIDYTANDFYKNYVSPTVQPTLNAANGLYIYYWGGVWKNVNPITSITIFESNGAQFLAGSTIAIYGMA